MGHAPYDAFLEAYWEHGTEGVWWSTYDPAHNTPGGLKQLSGLRALTNGDLLQIFSDASRHTPVWEGTVELDTAVAETGAFPRAGWHPHGLQKGVDPAFWFRLFKEEKPCRVFPAPQNAPVSSL